MADRPIDDTDLPPLTEAELREFRPAREVLPPEVMAAFKRGRGRPKAEQSKIAVSLRLDADVIARFKAAGPGWQTRINEALRSAPTPPTARRA